MLRCRQQLKGMHKKLDRLLTNAVLASIDPFPMGGIDFG